MPNNASGIPRVEAVFHTAMVVMYFYGGILIGELLNVLEEQLKYSIKY